MLLSSLLILSATGFACNAHLLSSFDGRSPRYNVLDRIRLGSKAIGSTAPLQPQTITLPLDHNNTNGPTFTNRYWVNDTFYQPGGPVFFFDGGEQDSEPNVPPFLQEEGGKSSVMRLAQKYKGVAILWEHRFYGKSLPPSGDDPSDTDLQFLGLEQALEDTVTFAKSFKLGDNKVSPSDVPWIWVGGSYPGMRGAVARLRNPDIWYAVWASSAVVQAQVDLVAYYNTVERALNANCSADLNAAIKYVDSILNGTDEDAANAVKKDLLKATLDFYRSPLPSDATLTAQAPQFCPELAASTLNLPLTQFQSFGVQLVSTPFCDSIETLGGTVSPSQQGIAASTGSAEAAYNAVILAVSNFRITSPPITVNSSTSQIGETNTVDAGLDIGISKTVDDFLNSCSQSFKASQFDGWRWQECFEFGFYTRGDGTNPENIQTTLASIDFFQDVCEVLWPGALPSSPSVDVLNKYGGWNMQPSNVMFTAGEFDPWRPVTLLSIEDNSPKRKTTQDVPACNTPPSGTDFYGMLFPGAVHAEDLFSAPNDVLPEPFNDGLRMFSAALDTWLPCYQSGVSKVSNGSNSTSPSSTSSDSSPTSSTGDKKNGALTIGVSLLTVALMMLSSLLSFLS